MFVIIRPLLKYSVTLNLRSFISKHEDLGNIIPHDKAGKFSDRNYSRY